jgi:Na+/serine symporter
MIQITYKPSANSESQAFLAVLLSFLDPLDEVRNKEIQETKEENLPGVGGVIEDTIINVITNPVTWYIADKALDVLIAAFVNVFINSLSNNASKALELNKDSKNDTIDLDAYANNNELEADLKKKLI